VKNGSDSDKTLSDVLAQFEHGYTGEGEKLHEALDRAWKKATKSSEHRVFRVQEIFVTGENPISGYGVVISPTG